MRLRLKMLIGSVLIVSFAFAGIVRAQETGQRPDRNQVFLAKHDFKMKRMKIRGRVESMSGREAVIRTSNGKLVHVMVGPESYWVERGYRLEPGEIVVVNGWYPEESTDWFFAGSIAGPGFTFSLTNSSGVPYWVQVDEQRRMAPSYVIYREWYGPQYIYRPAPRHDDERRDARDRDHDHWKNDRPPKDKREHGRRER